MHFVHGSNWAAPRWGDVFGASSDGQREAGGICLFVFSDPGLEEAQLTERDYQDWRHPQQSRHEATL
jgi:hypothetical protein